jgi:hypothetical protein
MFPVLCPGFPTAEWRDLQQLLEQGDCIENRSAPLFLLRASLPEFRGEFGTPLRKLHPENAAVCGSSIIRLLCGGAERNHSGIEI